MRAALLISPQGSLPRQPLPVELLDRAHAAAEGQLSADAGGLTCFFNLHRGVDSTRWQSSGDHPPATTDSSPTDMQGYSLPRLFSAPRYLTGPICIVGRGTSSDCGRKERRVGLLLPGCSRGDLVEISGGRTGLVRAVWPDGTCTLLAPTGDTICSVQCAV